MIQLPRDVIENDPFLWKWFEDESHKVWSTKDRCVAEVLGALYKYFWVTPYNIILYSIGS